MLDMTVAEVEKFQAQNGGQKNLDTSNLDKNKTVRQILAEQEAKKQIQQQIQQKQSGQQALINHLSQPM